MKKLGIFLVLVFFFVGMSCFAQSNNDAQRIVGTWKSVSPDGTETLTYVFNSNGTYTSTYTNTSRNSNENGNYFVSDSTIFLTRDMYSISTSTFSLSSDGKILAINHGHWYWYKKQ